MLRLAAFQTLRRLTEIAARVQKRRAQRLVRLVGEALLKLRQRLGRAQRRERQLGAAASDGGEHFFRVRREDQERAVCRRLLQDFQKRILRRLTHVLLQNVDLPPALIGADEHVRAHPPDHVHGDLLVVGVVY